MRKSPFEIITILMIVGIVVLMLASAVSRMTCKNGEDVPTGSGAMECYGTENYHTCKPETKFVCHDKD